MEIDGIIAIFAPNYSKLQSMKKIFLLSALFIVASIVCSGSNTNNAHDPEPQDTVMISVDSVEANLEDSSK